MSNTTALIHVRSALNGLILLREHSPTVQLRKGAALIWLIGVEMRVLCGVAGTVMNGICGCQGTIMDWGYEPMDARES